MSRSMTRRRFMSQTLGVIGGTMVAGELLPLLAEAAQRKQILRVAVDKDFASLRPDIWAGDTNYMLKRLIYTTPLLWGVSKQSDGTLMYDENHFEMVLATSYTLSEDRQTIEFAIRPDAKFANGDPITAQTVKASYGWHLDNRGPGSGQLKVNGLPSADHIEVVDDHTVRLRLDRPVAWGLIGNALLISCSIVHVQEIMKHATTDDPFGTKWLETHTIESGPFMIDQWERGAMMSLVPNPHFFQPPALERIILQVVPDASTRRIVLERGDVDFATQIATKDIPDLQKVDGVKAISYPSTRGWWLGMTWRKAPFNDMHVRRAIAWAMPYETILQVVTHGLAERLRSCVPNNVSGYAEGLWPYETDMEKARAELAQSVAPNGFSVIMPVYAGDALDEETSVMIKEALAPLGINITLQKMPIGQKNSLLVQKQVDMAVYTWRPWVTDAGYFIYWNWLPESFSNYWSYRNAEAQDIGNEAITMVVGSSERNAKLRRFQEIVNGDVGLVPLFTQFDNVTMREHVQGYVYYPDMAHFLAKLHIST